jgi:4-cresol dehydrogenase (hydroxylating) flavoprotein subunit
VSAFTGQSQWAAAVEAWRGLLGADHVWDDPARIAAWTENASGLERVIPAVLQPASTEEVQAVVRVANRYRTPLYPISTGGNWGLGSRLPVRDHTAVLDLGRMNRIHEINTDHLYAVVEPGVTQGQLYDRLCADRLPLVLNVTGSGRHTSLIGNALERGIGYFRSRAEALSGLEVVLGNGEILHTGFGHLAHSRITHLYRHGIGPDLTGLFAQSNFGVVTRAGFELIPQAEAHMSVIVKIREESDFVRLFDTLVQLRRRGVMHTIWHVGNRARSEIALGPLVYDQLLKRGAGDAAALRAEALALVAGEGFGPWNAVGGVMGSKALLRTMRRDIRAALKGVAEVVFLDDRKLALARAILDRCSFSATARRKRMLLEAIQPLYGLSKGIPTDAPLKSVCWPTGEDTAGPISDPDQSRSGMLYALPFIPLSGQAAKEVVDESERVFARHGFTPYTTFNFVNDQAAETVINLAFNRDDAGETARAHRCIDELTAAYIRLGYPPYRVGVQSMEQITDPDDSFWKTVRDLKQTLDPNHVIAPGRYNLV